MNNKLVMLKSLLLLASIFLSPFLTGCAARRISLVADYGFRIEKIDHARLVFRDVDIVKNGDRAEVTGYAERDGIAVPPLGPVDVVILDRNGNTKLLAATWLSPRRVPRRRGGSSTFELTLPSIPDPESVVVVRYHSSLSIPDEEKPDW